MSSEWWLFDQVGGGGTYHIRHGIHNIHEPLFEKAWLFCELIVMCGWFFPSNLSFLGILFIQRWSKCRRVMAIAIVMMIMTIMMTAMMTSILVVVIVGRTPIVRSGRLRSGGPQRSSRLFWRHTIAMTARIISMMRAVCLSGRRSKGLW